MGIWDRLAKVVASNVNSLLDKDDASDGALTGVSERADASEGQDAVNQRRLQQIDETIAQLADDESRLRQVAVQFDEQADTWRKRALVAQQCGDGEFASQALVRADKFFSERDRAARYASQLRRDRNDAEADKRNLEQVIAAAAEHGVGSRRGAGGVSSGVSAGAEGNTQTVREGIKWRV